MQRAGSAAFSRLISALIASEDAFLRAGQIARQLQKEIKAEWKTQTGDEAADIVTIADREVQEAVLRGLPRALLEQCRVMAEEITPTAAALSSEGPYFLTLDPVDGTKRYAAGSPYYSLILGLHDGQQPIYSFIYYPSLDWWIRLTDQVVTSGSPPWIEKERPDVSNSIVYTAGDPFREHPHWVEQAGRRGLNFVRGESVGPWGSKYLLLAGVSAGYYVSKPNVYDGLFGYHYGMAQGMQLQGSCKLAEPANSPRGIYYPGAYFVVREGL